MKATFGGKRCIWRAASSLTSNRLDNGVKKIRGNFEIFSIVSFYKRSFTLTARNCNEETPFLSLCINFALFLYWADINRWAIMEIRLECGSRLIKFTTAKLNVDRQWNERLGAGTSSLRPRKSRHRSWNLSS